MTDDSHVRANRWKRFSDWDERPLRLDKFAVEDASSGFAAFNSPYDPKPGLAMGQGIVESMDGIAVRDFDMIDIIWIPRLRPKRWRCPRSKSLACSST